MRQLSQRAATRAGLTLAVFLLVAGACLVGLAAITPWYTDSNAYSAGLAAIQTRLWGGEDADFRAASAAFHALQDQYRTPKWIYADLGYSALAWAGLVRLVVAFCRGGGRGWTTRKLFPVLGATAFGLGLLFAGLLAGPLQAMGREQVPTWADSYGIVLFSTFAAMAVVAPAISVLTLTPVLFTRRRPAPLFVLRGRGWLTSIIVSLIHLLPLAGAVLLISTAGQTGGWATSTAGALLGWALLNARAIWLGQRPVPETPAESAT